MPNYIVLVKQVPDVSQITNNAFNAETGNLVRSRLSNVINELDARALAFANDMREKSNDKQGEIVALSMGPPMAEEVLRYALGRCADKGVLLTDRTLSGADTFATANPLASAIRKIVKELFKGNEDYYIVSGMQSVDGDTAQVPAQIAEELHIPCIAYDTVSKRENGKFVFTRISSGGSQQASLKYKPAVVTVADFEYPLFPTFKRTRWAMDFEIITWSNDDIQASYTGAKGSKTWVTRVFPPGKTTRKQQKIEDVAQLAKVISENLLLKDSNEMEKQEGGQKAYVLPAKRSSCFDRSYEGTQKEIDDFRFLAEKLKQEGINRPDEFSEELEKKLVEECKGTLNRKAIREMLEGFRSIEPMYQGDVWVVAERTENGLHPGTVELIGEARKLADSLEVNVGVVIAGHQVASLKDESVAAGADYVYLIEHPLLNQFDPWPYRKVISACVKEYDPQILLFAATPQGRVLAPMIAYRLGCGLTADCTGLEIKDRSRKGQIALLMQTRPALGGNIMATIGTKDSSCQMATVRPGVMKRPEPDYSRQGEVVTFNADISEQDVSLDIISTESGGENADFEADVIVSGGKGMQNRDNFERLLGGLSLTLQESFGIAVERGATRAAVEQGFVERGYQVGQTGTSVGPKLYFAVGISGAIQHMIGVSNSELIIAVNNDSEAPIFEYSDYYIVASAEEVIPELTEELSKISKNVQA